MRWVVGLPAWLVVQSWAAVGSCVDCQMEVAVEGMWQGQADWVSRGGWKVCFLQATSSWLHIIHPGECSCSSMPGLVKPWPFVPCTRVRMVGLGCLW